jgi:hypothetical protein
MNYRVYLRINRFCGQVRSTLALLVATVLFRMRLNLLELSRAAHACLYFPPLRAFCFRLCLYSIDFFYIRLLNISKTNLAPRSTLLVLI